MATEFPIYDRTFLAGADLTGSAFRFVKLNASGQVIPIAAVTDVPIGVLQEAAVAAAVGTPVLVRMIGVSKMEAGAAIVPGAVIGPDAVGRAITKVIGTDLTHYVSGVALDAVGALASRGSVFISCIPNRAT